MHSLVFVILPSGTEETLVEVEKAVRRLLAGSELNPERTYGSDPLPCPCHGSQARNEAYRRVDECPEGVERLRALDAARQKGDAETEERILAERSERVAKIERAHPRRDDPDPGCATCQGSGTYRISRDPLRHHDDWTLGGRWDRLFKPGDVEDPLLGNLAPARQILEHTPKAVVTPDGDWRERPTLLGETDRAAVTEWDAFLRELLLRYSDHLVAVVDCHA